MWLYHRVMSPNDADRMANSVTLIRQSDLGLHCLLRHICLKTGSETESPGCDHYGSPGSGAGENFLRSLPTKMKKHTFITLIDKLLANEVDLMMLVETSLLLGRTQMEVYCNEYVRNRKMNGRTPFNTY